MKKIVFCDQKVLEILGSKWISAAKVLTEIWLNSFTIRQLLFRVDKLIRSTAFLTISVSGFLDWYSYKDFRFCILCITYIISAARSSSVIIEFGLSISMIYIRFYSLIRKFLLHTARILVFVLPCTLVPKCSVILCLV